jgi:hypothetical protein
MKYFLTVCFLAFTSSIWAFETVKISPSDERIDLFGRSYIFSDTSNALEAIDVASLPFSAWKKATLTGYSAHHEWILLPFENLSDQTFDKVLYLSNAISHTVDFYFIENGKLTDTHIESGLSRSSKTKLYNDPAYPVKLHLPAHSKVYALVRIVDPLSSINEPFFVLSFDHALAIKDKNNSYSFFWLGVVVLSIILYLFI